MGAHGEIPGEDPEKNTVADAGSAHLAEAAQEFASGQCP